MGFWYCFLIFFAINFFNLGKSLLLPKIRESMTSFSRSWQDGIELYWSWILLIVLFVLCFLFTLITVSIVKLYVDSTNLLYTLIFGVSVYAILVSIYGFIYYGSEIKLWNGSIIVARFIARHISKYFYLFTIKIPKLLI